MPTYVPTGRKPTGGGLSTVWNFSAKKRLAAKMMNDDIANLLNNLVGIRNRQSFYYLVTKYVSTRLIKISAEILQDAARRCPYETGKLRESGRVHFAAGDTTLGKQTEVARVTDGKADNPSVEVITPTIAKGARMIVSEIRFTRVVKGRDLALWAHEELLHYVKRPKSPSQKGFWFSKHYRTGPKYLENAFQVRRGEVQAEIELAVMEAVREYNRKHGTRARRRSK